MRALIVSLSTYTSMHNDGKLAELGRRIDRVVAVAGDVPTLWGGANASRAGTGYEVRVLRTRYGRSNATTQLVGLDRLAAAVRPTVIHAECEPWQGVAIQCVRLAHRLGVPVGIQFAENGPLMRGAGGALRTLGARWCLSRCRYAIGWSAESTAIAARLAPGLATRTYPGTGVPAIAGTPSEVVADRWFGEGSLTVPRLAFVGRFSPEKGLREFLTVADLLAERLPVRVAIAGGSRSDGQLGAWLASRPWASSHGILPRSEVSELLAAADVLVCPSRTTPRAKEQFGKAPVEAMALGTPVFAFDCGALAEVVGDGGVVVPEGACLALADALERYFATSAAVRAELGAKARARAERFTDASLAEGLIDLWSHVVPVATGPGRPG
ncbi:MAG: glycosyltransferase family 4 protein [Gaiellales bacterium]